MPGPLERLRVVDCSAIIAGPAATAFLATYGADVVKLEPLEGDALRSYPSTLPGLSRYFLGINRGKRSLAVDLKHPDGLAIARRLARDRGRVRRELPAGRRGPPRARRADAPRRERAAHLLLRVRVRPDRTARRAARPRPGRAVIRRPRVGAGRGRRGRAGARAREPRRLLHREPGRLRHPARPDRPRPDRRGPADRDLAPRRRAGDAGRPGLLGRGRRAAGGGPGSPRRPRVADLPHAGRPPLPLRGAAEVLDGALPDARPRGVARRSRGSRPWSGATRTRRSWSGPSASASPRRRPRSGRPGSPRRTCRARGSAPCRRFWWIPRRSRTAPWPPSSIRRSARSGCWGSRCAWRARPVRRPARPRRWVSTRTRSWQRPACPPDEIAPPPAGGRRTMTAPAAPARARLAPARQLASPGPKGRSWVRTGSRSSSLTGGPHGNDPRALARGRQQGQPDGHPAPAGHARRQATRVPRQHQGELRAPAPPHGGAPAGAGGPHRRRVRAEGELVDPRPARGSRAAPRRSTWSSPAPPTEGPARRGVSTTQ